MNDEIEYVQHIINDRTPKTVFVCTYKIRQDFRTYKDLTG